MISSWPVPGADLDARVNLGYLHDGGSGWRHRRRAVRESVARAPTISSLAASSRWEAVTVALDGRIPCGCERGRLGLDRRPASVSTVRKCA